MKLKNLFVLILLSSCATSIPKATVMVTNLAENSGGSGSVVSASTHMSEVLTNGHVCEVVKHGGVIKSYGNKKSAVVGYKKSLRHDLCLIVVYSDLEESVRVAYLPSPTYGIAVVSGHPHLLPNIISEGKFSDKKIIKIMVGTRPCTTDEFTSPDTQFYCALTGRLPIIKTYESVVLSALIQPGSSGSAVYNEYDNIAAVVFAGGGDLSYGYAVPQEYVYDFLHNESKELPLILSDNGGVETAQETSASDWLEQVKSKCDDIHEDKYKKYCETVDELLQIDDLIYRK